MKTSLLIALLGFSGILTACSDAASPAEKYLASGASQDATVDPPDPSPAPAPKVEPAPATGPAPSTAPVVTGDAVKGAAVIKSTCAAVCHFTGGLGKNPLSSSYIAKLDLAWTGPNSANHKGYPDAFTGPGRKDIEAALKAIP